MEYKLPQRKEISNKSTYGRVLNISGSDYMSGAAYLSSVSALKIGCGYCFLCSTEKCMNIVASQTQNIVFVPYDKLEENIKTADVIEIGCGLGQNWQSNKIFEAFLKYTPADKKIIVDADGLNIISQNPEKFICKGFKNVVFTPHPKEAARLLNVDNVLDNIEEAAKLISEKYGCTTILKTHNTFIYSPENRTYTNTTGSNALAKAGSGDVLTGMISGLIAQGMDTFEGACLGVYLHGLCGDIKAKELTQYSVMAQDLIDAIPSAIKTLL